MMMIKIFLGLFFLVFLANPILAQRNFAWGDALISDDSAYFGSDQIEELERQIMRHDTVIDYRILVLDNDSVNLDRYSASQLYQYVGPFGKAQSPDVLFALDIGFRDFDVHVTPDLENYRREMRSALNKVKGKENLVSSLFWIMDDVAKAYTDSKKLDDSLLEEEQGNPDFKEKESSDLNFYLGIGLVIVVLVFSFLISRGLPDLKERVD